MFHLRNYKSCLQKVAEALNFSGIAATEKNKLYHTQVDHCNKDRYKTETSKAISGNVLIGFRKHLLENEYISQHQTN